ncbi:hypothetical protein JCM10207_006532 [Rhodosporidiobolus poonsookiae]
MTITANDLIRWAKKAFTFYKKWKKSQDQKLHQQQQQQGGSYSQHAQQQQGAWGQQQSQPSPYPKPQQQQQHGAWNQGHGQVQSGYGGGGYGAHDGPATTRLPLEVFELAVQRLERRDVHIALDRRWRLTPFAPLPSTPFSSSTTPSTRRATPPVLSTLARTFSTSSASLFRPPYRPPYSFYDPSTRFTQPRAPPSAPRPPPLPPPPPPSTLIPYTIFSSLPSYLRPSYRKILDLVGWDRLVAVARGNAEWDEQNQDMANAQNSHYVDLRNRAIREGDLMAKAFSSSKQAYASGDGGAAHDLSTEGKQHQREKDRLNAEAAEWIFNENNRTQPAGSVDLHGLYVQEAIDYTERAISNARAQGFPELRVIVGKGNHSPSHVAKIKPAITSLMQRENLTAHLDPHNGGVLVVQLQGQGGGRSGGQFVREMEESDSNDCTIM